MWSPPPASVPSHHASAHLFPPVHTAFVNQSLCGCPRAKSSKVISPMIQRVYLNLLQEYNIDDEDEIGTQTPRHLQLQLRHRTGRATTLQADGETMEWVMNEWMSEWWKDTTNCKLMTGSKTNCNRQETNNSMKLIMAPKNNQANKNYLYCNIGTLNYSLEQLENVLIRRIKQSP